ncbi:replication-relaxation family protein [Flagellatimonas centrodinii]|uniref:replication-relaxation family protein n=1 Tax=Flagellatimonas centrodinii TaxID=2806210 RepID=UPI001FEF9F4B|nr:replication-relaxation family protein [Flagellatimonas centrodinii]ULQ45938.1 replication-relaxation family protein [Flagellatimonas centrodinii]
MSPQQAAIAADIIELLGITGAPVTLTSIRERIKGSQVDIMETLDALTDAGTLACEALAGQRRTYQIVPGAKLPTGTVAPAAAPAGSDQADEPPSGGTSGPIIRDFLKRRGTPATGAEIAAGLQADRSRVDAMLYYLKKRGEIICVGETRPARYALPQAATAVPAPAERPKRPPSSLSAIKRLAEHGPATTRQVAAALGNDVARLNVYMRNLATSGHVNAVAGSNPKRWAITDAGLQLLASNGITPRAAPAAVSPAKPTPAPAAPAQSAAPAQPAAADDPYRKVTTGLQRLEQMLKAPPPHIDRADLKQQTLRRLADLLDPSIADVLTSTADDIARFAATPSEIHA